MLTGEQIRGARAMLGWSITELANRSAVSWRTLRRAEGSGATVPQIQLSTALRIKTALEAAGIEFLQAGQKSEGGGPGIRLQR